MVASANSSWTTPSSRCSPTGSQTRRTSFSTCGRPASGTSRSVMSSATWTITWTNVPGGFVADATTGPLLATLVTPVSAILPSAANDQTLVQVRIITANVALKDEWVGVDDIQVAGTA